MTAFAPLRDDDDFPLWAFRRGNDLVLTRGRTAEEASRYMGGLPAERDVPIDGARWYTANHAPGWLTRPMWWLCEALGLDPRDHGHEDRAARIAAELRAVLLHEALRRTR